MKAERNWDKGEWTLFKPLLEKEDYYEPTIITERNLTNAYTIYTKNFTKFCTKCAPRKEGEQKSKRIHGTTKH